MLISKLDTTLVYTYKQFTKAIKDKRLNTFDDSTNYALLHYKKLTSYKLPDHIVQRMKRGLGAALQERELNLMKDVREKGKRLSPLEARVPVIPAIGNLEEAMKLFGPNHYFYNYLQARKLILETLIQWNQRTLGNTYSLEMRKQIREEEAQISRTNVKNLLLKGIQLEPNTVSAYAFFGSFYMVTNQPDSAWQTAIGG